MKWLHSVIGFLDRLIFIRNAKPEYEIILGEVRECGGGLDAVFRLRHWLIISFLVFLTLFVTTDPIGVTRLTFSGVVVAIIVCILIYDFLDRRFPQFSTHKYRVLRFQTYIIFGGLLYYLGRIQDWYLLFFSAYLVFAPVYVGQAWTIIGIVECVALVIAIPFHPNVQGLEFEVNSAFVVTRAAVILLTGAIASYLWHRQLRQHLETADQEQRLLDAAAQLIATLDFNEVSRMAFELLKEHIQFETALIVADLDGEGVYTPLAHWGYPEIPQFEFKASMDGEGYTGYILATRQSLRVPPIYHDQAIPQPKYPWISPNKPLRSYVGAPLNLGRRTVGALIVTSDTPYAFGADDEYILMRVARWLAVAISNANAHLLLRRETEFLTTLLNFSTDGILVADSKGKIIHCNPEAQDTLGYERTEILGKKVSDFYWNGLEEARRVKRLVVETGGRVGDIDSEVRTKTNDRIPITLSAVQLQLPEGEILGTVGYFQDMSKEPLAGKRRRVLHRASRLPLEYPGATVADLASCLVEILHEAAPSMCCAILHLRDRNVLRPAGSFGEVQAQFLERTLSIGWEVQGMVWQTRQRIVSSDLSTDLRFKEDKSVAWPGIMSLVCLPLSTGSHLWGTLSLYADHAQQFPDPELDFYSQFADQAALTLASVSAMEAQISEERTRTILEIAQMLAHEMRSPVTTIKGWIQLLQETPDLPRQSLALNECERAAIRLERIIKQQLLYARRLRLTPRNVALHELVEQTLTIPDIRQQLSGRNIRVHKVADHIWALVDPDLLQTAMVNLLQNSIDAQPSGGEITIEVTRVTSGEICIRVSDSGPGISTKDFKDLQEIFEPFTTTKAVSGRSGIGLGLALTRRIIEAHGGEIVAENLETKRGAAFTITLPPEITSLDSN